MNPRISTEKTGYFCKTGLIIGHTFQNGDFGRACKSLSVLEAAVGIEPTDKGFADLCLTTWLRRLEYLDWMMTSYWIVGSYHKRLLDRRLISKEAR
jgi:hypothetical protein